MLTAACGGAHPKAVTRVDDTATSTTDAAPTTTAPRAKKIARHSTSTTVGRSKKPATTTPATHGAAAVVIPAVGAGGAAPATLPTAPSSPSGGGTTHTTVKPFDPTQNIDLSGTPGVTAAQQAAAEALVRNTLRDLPRFANQSAAFAAGYRTIGDSATGDEHWVNWAYANDADIFDSKHPESLVYGWSTGHPVLEAAMYMLPPGSQWTDIPNVYKARSRSSTCTTTSASRR